MKMIVVYDSNTGVGKRFAESLGYPTQTIKEKLEEPCILITRNAGAGKIPWSTKRFIKKHPGLIKGFVNNGDSVKHGRTFCGATALIIEKYGLQHICDIDQGGTPEDVKSFIEEKYKGYNGLKGVKQTIEIKDGKVVQDLEVDFSVASISELRKALPEEYSGIGNRVSFSNSKKALEKMGFTEKTN